MNYVVVEGVPAAGKSETLELLARFYPHRVRVLPELVKTLVQTEGIDLFNERARLTEAIRRALPERRAQVQELISRGFLCLEESHLGVHYAYSAALGDRDFLELYPSISNALPVPDAYIRLDLPVGTSLDRQEARGTVEFDVDGPALARMLSELDRWHAGRKTPLIRIDADRPASAMLTDLEHVLELDYATRGLPNEETFDILLLLGRPASGKSEFIDFMSQSPAEHRAREFFIAPFRVIDDFPILWNLFQQDDDWEVAGRERLTSKKVDKNYSVANDSVWAFLIERINRQVREDPTLATRTGSRTLIIEFSRGGSSGYRDAFKQLSPEILRRCAILYVSVSFEESWQRNVARYDQKLRDGILTHSVPRDEMERTYGTDDWLCLASEASGFIHTQGFEIPYVTMPNEPESKDPDVLAERYRAALGPLYALWSHRSASR